MTKYSKGYIYSDGLRSRHIDNARIIQNAFRRHRHRRNRRMDDMIDEVFELGRYAPRRRRRINRENVIAAFGPTPPRRRDPRNVWDAPQAAGGGSELMSQRGGVRPGHANIPNVYDENVDSLRGRQNQNPHWIGTRTNHRDPNITQQSMEDFIQRHRGPSRANRPLDAAGAGLLSTLQGAVNRDMKDYI